MLKSKRNQLLEAAKEGEVFAKKGYHEATVSEIVMKARAAQGIFYLYFSSKREIFGLVGPDGAGKTSTIQMLCGISTPSSGSAIVAGVVAVKEPELLGGKIGYMSEGFTL